eukprot:SAG22_NODE_72_length_22344_cov_95.586559_12_plen_710_part_00
MRAVPVPVQAAGEHERAEQLFLQIAEQVPERRDVCIYNIAVMAEQDGHFDVADELYGEVETRRLVVVADGGSGETDQLLLRARMGIVNILDHWGHLDKAEELCTEVLASQTAHLGEDHPDTLRSQMNLAGFVGERGAYEQARRLAEQVHAKQVASLGADHPDVLLTQHNKLRLAALRIEADNRAAAAAAGGGGAGRGRRRSSTASTGGGGGGGTSPRRGGQPNRVSATPPAADHSDSLAELPTPRTELWEEASRLQAAGEFGEAELLYVELAEQDPARADLCLYNIAVMHEQAGNYETADMIYSNVETRRLAVLNGSSGGGGGGEGTDGKPKSKTSQRSDDQLLLRARMGIVNILDHWGHHQVAEELCTEVLASQTAHLGEDHPDTLRSQMNLAGFVGERGDTAAARRLIELVHEKQAASLGADHPDVLLTRYNLGCLLADEGDLAAAEAVCEAVAQAQALALGPAHPAVIRTQANLAELTGSGAFIGLPPPPPAGAALGTLRLTLLSAERLRPTRHRGGSSGSGSGWQATTASGAEVTGLESGRCRPYALAAVAGAGGLAQRSEPAGGSPGGGGGGGTVADKKLSWEAAGGGGVLEFRLQELPEYLRLFCFDALGSDAATTTAADGSRRLAWSTDGDAFCGAGELGWVAGATAGPFEELRGVELQWPAGGDVWQADYARLPAVGGRTAWGDSVEPAGLLQVKVRWVPP